jgi:hypothetical protein
MRGNVDPGTSHVPGSVFSIDSIDGVYDHPQFVDFVVPICLERAGCQAGQTVTKTPSS